MEFICRVLFSVVFCWFRVFVLFLVLRLFGFRFGYFNYRIGFVVRIWFRIRGLFVVLFFKWCEILKELKFVFMAYVRRK